MLLGGGGSQTVGGLPPESLEDPLGHLDALLGVYIYIYIYIIIYVL